MGKRMAAAVPTHIFVYNLEGALRYEASIKLKVVVGAPPVNITCVILETVRVVHPILGAEGLEELVRQVWGQRDLWPSVCPKLEVVSS